MGSNYMPDLVEVRGGLTRTFHPCLTITIFRRRGRLGDNRRMRSVTVLLCALLATACLARSQAVRSAQPVIDDTSAETTATDRPAVTTVAPSRSAAVYRDPTLFAQPQPARPQQPFPQQAPQQQPYPQQPPTQQPPYPQQPTQPPYPQQPTYPQQPAQPPYPQPPTQQPYPQPQPQPYPQPYPPQQPPYPYPPQQQPYPQPYPQQQARPRFHNGEVIADFAAVGALASIDILIRQDIDDGGAGTLIMLAGVGGGGALGWLLTDRYTVDAAAAHATTLGLLAGAATGALLIRPSESYDAADVMGLLFLGSAVGAGAGFAYGQAADLTSGQTMFLGNAVLLGTATAALVGITGSRNGTFDNWENGALALGLDAGILAGALIAPSLDWSPGRARTVFAMTTLGALVGGMIPSLATRRDDGEDFDGDLITGAMTAGLWGGFGLGILMTRGAPPDPKYGNPGKPAGPVTSYVPFVGDRGQVGLMAGGTW